MAEAASGQPAAGQARQQRGLGTSLDPLVLSDDDSVEAKRRCLGLGTSDDPFKFSDDESVKSVEAPAPPPSSSEQQQVRKWLDAPRLIASSQSAACSLDISGGQSAAVAHLVAHGAKDHGKTRYVVHNLQTALRALAASGLAEQDPDVPVETTVKTVGVMHCQGEGAINDRCPRKTFGGASVAVALDLLGCTPDVLSSGFVIPDLDAFATTVKSVHVKLCDEFPRPFKTPGEQLIERLRPDLEHAKRLYNMLVRSSDDEIESEKIHWFVFGVVRPDVAFVIFNDAIASGDVICHSDGRYSWSSDAFANLRLVCGRAYEPSHVIKQARKASLRKRGDSGPSQFLDEDEDRYVISQVDFDRKRTNYRSTCKSASRRPRAHVNIFTCLEHISTLHLARALVDVVIT